MPRVSVIIPNYNHAPFLERRMESVLKQTYQDFEVLLLDDCSTDGSREVIERYRGQPRLQIHYNAANSGSPFAQWNRGIELSRGEYVWIAESDDGAEPGLLAGLVPLLESDSNVVLAYCASRMMDERDRPLGIAPDPGRGGVHGRFHKRFTRSGTDELDDQLTSVCNEIPNASGVLFRADALREAGPADASYRLVGDWAYYARLMLLGSVAFTPETWNRFRCHDATAREIHRATGRRWVELCRFYEWAIHLDRWTKAQRREMIRHLAAHFIAELRARRARLGVSRVGKSLVHVLMNHAWLRTALIREMGHQATARLVGR